MQGEKLLPHSTEAEEAVAGSLIIDGSCLPEVRAIIGPGDFFGEKNRWVYEAALAVGAELDQITLAHELERRGQLEAIGGAAYLSHLVSVTPTSVHARYYARVIARCAYQRKMIGASAEIAKLAYGYSEDSMDLYAQVGAMLRALEPEAQEGIVGPKEHAEAMLGMLSERQQGNWGCLPFGYRDLDVFVGGMYPGNLIIVGAWPSTGKSQVLLEVAIHNAEKGRVVLFASAEMSLKELTEREISMGAGLDIKRLRRGELDDAEWGGAQAVVAKASQMPLYFLDRQVTVDRIVHYATLLYKTRGLEAVFVDFIQLLADKPKGKETMGEAVGHVGKALKQLARDLEVPVVAASQLREVEGGPKHKPGLNDLKWARALGEHADLVLLLHRPELYKPESKPGICEVLVVKVRQGGQHGIRELVWVEREHRYGDLARGV